MQQLWTNTSGDFFSSYEWLNAHHLAKLKERKLFAEKICSSPFKIITDLGCGFGFWLDVFNQVAEHQVRFIGIDRNYSTLESARELSKSWDRETTFLNIDIESQQDKIPDSEVYILFNMLSYINSPRELLNTLKCKLLNGGKIIIRQFDGSVFHFGPMEQESRAMIENSILASMSRNQRFNNYAVDELYSIIMTSDFKNINVKFEPFYRTYPFDQSFKQYLGNELDWLDGFLGLNAKKIVREWRSKYLDSINDEPAYCLKVDMVVELSD